MNESKRKVLRHAVSLLESAYNKVQNVLEQENDSMDNLPDNLQETEMYRNMEIIIEDLEKSLDSIDEASENIKCAIGG